MKLSNSQIKILQRINGNLENGDITAIAKNSGKTRVYVGSVLNPFAPTYNEDIVNAAVTLIAEREISRKDLLRKIPN